VHSTNQHSQSRARSRSTSALQPTSILYIIISLIMDNIQHLLTQQPATTKRMSGNESRRSRVTPTNSSNITTSASKATSWNPFLYRFSHHFSREAPAIIFLLHITSSLLFPAEFFTVWSTHMAFGFLLFRVPGRRVAGWCPFPFYFAIPFSLFFFCFFVIFGFRLEIYITRSTMCVLEKRRSVCEREREGRVG
jgi:hypothetical protein